MDTHDQLGLVTQAEMIVIILKQDCNYFVYGSFLKNISFATIRLLNQ